MRAVAILLVITYHSLAQYPPAAKIIPGALYSGYAGVDLFFVISGFIMMHITKPDDFSAKQFLLKRVNRIIPLYWLILSLLTAIWVVNPRLVQVDDASMTIGYVVKSYLLIPMMDRPLLGIAWSLQNEFIFYALLAGVLACGYRKYATHILLFFFLAGIVVNVIVPEIRRQPVADLKLLSLFYFEFAAGVVAHTLYSNRRIRYPLITTVCGALLFLGTGWLYATLYSHSPFGAPGTVIPVGIPGLLRVTGFGMASFLLVIGTVSMQPKGIAGRIMVRVGNASYIIYLTHDLVIVPAGKFTAMLVTSLTQFLLWALVVGTFAVGLGLVAHWAIEEPLLRWTKRWSLRTS